MNNKFWGHILTMHLWTFLQYKNWYLHLPLTLTITSLKKITQLEKSHAESMAHDMGDEIVDKEEMGTKEKAIQKQINKITKHAISRCIQNGAYTDEKFSRHKYVFQEISLQESNAGGPVDSFRDVKWGLKAMTIIGSRISWTIADAASVDAANEGAVNIVDYQIENLLAKCIASAESKFSSDTIANWIKEGLDNPLVTHSMKGRSAILFPDRYLNSIFSDLEGDLNINKEMENIYAEVGGEENYYELTQWATNHETDYVNQYNAAIGNAIIIQRNFEAARDLVLALDQIRKLSQDKSE